MGCWNETCGLTNLPIFYGEKTCAVIIEELRPYNKSCLSAENWCPIGPAIWGNYSGYGYIEDIPDEEEVKNFYRQVMEKNGAKFVDKSMNACTFDHLDIFFRYVQEGEIYCIHDGTIHHLQVVLFSKDAVERAKKNPDLMFYKTMKPEDIFCTYGMNSKLLRTFYNAGADLTDVVTIDLALRKLRRNWCPTSGCGSQNSIETEWLADWYEAVAEKARALYEETQRECW